MVHNFPTTDRPVRIPPIAWFLGLGLFIALVAIFVFNVPLGTVGYVAFIAFFMGSHFFMHGSHGGHDGNEQRTDVQANVDGRSGAAQSKPNEHARHSAGCH
jgi:hypothetical protein